MRRIFPILLFGLVAANAFGMRLTKGQWLGTAGIGPSLGPTLIVLTPQLEYVYDSDLLIGTMGQLGIGSGILFTFDGSVRYLLGRPGKYQPFLEGALGLAMASQLFQNSMGAHIMTGFGVDYAWDSTTSISACFRLNFAPPVKGMFVTIPLIMGRFLL